MKHFLLLLVAVSLFAKTYILNSDVNQKRYKQLHLNLEKYNDNLNRLKQFIINNGYKVSIISENALNKLQNNDVLFIIDSFAISKKAQIKILEFVAKGGIVVFNFKTAFLDEKGNITKHSFLEKITNLKIKDELAPQKKALFVINHILSPIYTKNSKRLDINLYDSIPILKGKTPDLEFTNWAITSSGFKKRIGVLWHGRYKKGGWIYFSFPFYIFDSEIKLKNGWQEIINSLIKYAIEGISIRKYPYLKYDKMSFISEDTEYKYVNFKNFINVLKKYDVNGTAFCVGKLATKYPTLMKEAGKINLLEIGSHSYSHTQLTNKSLEVLKDLEINGNNRLLKILSNQTIRGFRPPREEVNKKMLDVIKQSTLRYVLAKNLSQLKPKYIGDLMFLSRIGTDDYQYLMELDLNKTQIINQMKQEVDFVTSLNGLYTMSTHTHLMCYKSNIKMLDALVSYIKKRKYPILKGKDIVKLIYMVDNIKVDYNAPFINIKNNLDNNIDEFIFRVFHLNDIKIDGGIKLNQKDDYIDIKILNIKPHQSVDLKIR